MRWLKLEMAGWKEPLGWIAVGGGLLLFSLAATFPYGAVQARLITELERATGLDVRVAEWSMGVPLTLEWRQMTLSRPDWPPIQLGVVRARVGVMTLLSGGMNVDLSVRVDDSSAAQGTVASTVTASSWSFKGPTVIAGQVRQVDLSKLVRPYVARGILTGDFTQRVSSGTDGPFGDGIWKAEAKDVSLENLPVGNGRTLALSFTTLSLGMNCRGAVCEVTEMKGDGIDGTVTGQGSVTLHQPLPQSQLALSVTVVPGVGFASKAAGLGIPPLPPGTPVTFKIVGPLAQPRMAL